jgi:hypothetical protein
MKELLIHDPSVLIWWLGILSIMTFVISLFLIPFLVVRIPADYFLFEKRQSMRKKAGSPRIAIWVILKNLVGACFILAGMAMLVLPGQGLLTILIGVMMTNFPGKFALERSLVRSRTVLRAMNWIRRRNNRPPLRID